MQDGTTETNHGVIDYLVVVGTDWWEGLEPAVREQLDTIMQEVTAERNAEVTQIDEDAKAAIVAAGGEVRTLTDEQRQEWVDAMKPVWAQFEAGIGAENIAAAQALNEGS